MRSAAALRRWTWIWIPLAFFVTVMGWAVAAPIGSAPDDDYHLASIWCGMGEREGACSDPGVLPATLLVPAPVVQAAACYAFRPEVPASCSDPVLGSTELAGTRHINQLEGLYPGAFYQVMGLLVGPDVERSVLAMRTANALLASLLLAAVLRLLPAGIAGAAALAVVVTFVPLGLSLVASTNPSSWAIVGIGTYWAFLLAFLIRGRANDRRGVLIAAGAVVSAAMAIAARVDSAAYVAVASVIVVVLAGWPAIRRRPWRSLLPAALSIVGISTYAMRGQPLTGGAGSLGNQNAGTSLLLTNLVDFPALIQGMVGGWPLAWNDVELPPLVSVIGLLVVGALVYRGLSLVWTAKLWAAGIAALALVALPLAYLQQQRLGTGEMIQPRYLLPLFVMLLGILSVGPRYGQPLPFHRAPKAVMGVALSLSALVSYWSFVHRFAWGRTVSLFDSRTLDAPLRLLDASMPVLIVCTSVGMVALICGVLMGAHRQVRASAGVG